VGLVREDLEEVKAIEVGNIFHLESKYTDELGVYYTDEAGERRSIVMGCYGIGISRLMGAVAEIFADDRGLVWPEEVAPFGYYLVGIGAEGMRVAGELYAGHEAEILWDDRDGRVGEKFVDSELLGIPYRVVVSDKSLARGEVEVVARRSGEKKMLTLDEIKSRL
jgi:prolyl-tRNA synthetase